MLSEYVNSGNPTNPNADLKKHGTDIADAYIKLIASGGHADVNYINTTKKAIAILQAASINQSVLDSEEVKAMLLGIKAPDDAYVARVYANMAQPATDAFNANGGVLAKGFTDPHKETIKSIYNYLLLAGLTDAQIAGEVQKIKDAEAAAAAAAAAAQNNFNPSEVEAIAADPNRLLLAGVDRAASAHGWKDTKRILIKEFIAGGATLAAATGAAGNAFAESGYNPGIVEKTTRLQKGFGYFQWTFERRTSMENAAKQEGVSSADPSFQARYGVWESKQRTQRDGSGNEWEAFAKISNPEEAAGYWRWNFERPDERVAHSDQRVKEAITIYEQVNGQMEAIKQEAAAAANARAAEAARIEAERQRSRTVDEANLFKDSTGVKCAPETPSVGPETGYRKGDPVPVELCQLPNTRVNGTPASVNARAAGVAFAMFEQMRKDLGLEFITLNDEFRTNAEQIAAKKQYGVGAADPGHSNHQMGMAFDVNMGPANKGNSRTYRFNIDTKYPGNPVWEWLKAHAGEYHFQQYSKEGWHWSIDGH